MHWIWHHTKQLQNEWDSWDFLDSHLFFSQRRKTVWSLKNKKENNTVLGCLAAWSGLRLFPWLFPWTCSRLHWIPKNKLGNSHFAAIIDKNYIRWQKPTKHDEQSSCLHAYSHTEQLWHKSCDLRNKKNSRKRAFQKCQETDQDSSKFFRVYIWRLWSSSWWVSACNFSYEEGWGQMGQISSQHHILDQSHRLHLAAAAVVGMVLGCDGFFEAVKRWLLAAVGWWLGGKNGGASTRDDGRQKWKIGWVRCWWWWVEWWVEGFCGEMWRWKRERSSLWWFEFEIEGRTFFFSLC